MSTLQHIWELIVAEDIRMHKTPIENIPIDFISAAEIVEAQYGLQAFLSFTIVDSFMIICF